jgi:hypothetical protein
MSEIWKDIKGYEGLYKISNKGNVMSLRKTNGESNGMRKLSYSHKGYLIIVLSKEGKPKTHRVHRLVATAFIPNPYNLPEVNHIDENKTNNSAENLEWCTQIYNLKYGKRSEKISNILSHPVIATSIITGKKLYFKSLRATEKYGFTQSSISRCLKGLHKQHKGFLWSYR